MVKKYEESIFCSLLTIPQDQEIQKYIKNASTKLTLFLDVITTSTLFHITELHAQVECCDYLRKLLLRLSHEISIDNSVADFIMTEVFSRFSNYDSLHND